MSNLPPITILQREESSAIFELSTRTDTVVTKLFQISGNSILSSVFIKSIDVGATIDVEYFQTTSGTFEEDGELQQLNFHRQFTDVDAGKTEMILVTRIHNKPQCRITVSGTAEFGVYGSVRSETASDVDNALQLDASDVDLATDKGIPTMLYDELDGKFYFLRGDKGVLPVSISEAGDAVHLSFNGLTTPAVEQTLISSVVPVAKDRRINKVRVVCRSHGYYHLLKNSVIIGSGRTGPAKANSEMVFTPRYPFAVGETLQVKYTAAAGSPVQNIEVYVMGNDLDV